MHVLIYITYGIIITFNIQCGNAIEIRVTNYKKIKFPKGE